MLQGKYAIHETHGPSPPYRACVITRNCYEEVIRIMNANFYTVSHTIMVIEVILSYLKGPDDSIREDLLKQSFDQMFVYNWTAYSC